MKSYLTTRTAEGAFPMVLKLFREEDWVKLRVAHRIGINYTTLWRWLKRNPGLAKRINTARAAALAQEIE